MKKNIIYLSQITPDELQSYMVTNAKELAKNKLYNDLKDLNESYPGFDEWYDKKIINSIEKKDGTREIIFMFVKNGIDTEIAGLSIVKKTKKEKKICTLRVLEKYRRNGIAKKLFEESFKYLEEKKPLFTVSEDKHEEFKSLINEFEFKLNEKKKGHYIYKKIEYVYNGKL